MKAFSPTILTFSFLLVFSASFSQVRNYTHAQEPLPCLNKTFSVVVHILRDSSGATNINPDNIPNRFADLNAAFEPICARFEVCETRIIDNFQYDVLEDAEEWNELLVKYHVPNRINVFLVFNNMLDIPQECGFATMNGIQDTESGGIVINKGGCLEDGSKAIQHLFGHYFGLLHTFEGNGIENVNGDNCATEGDLICDTPADPYRPPQDLYGAGYLAVQYPCRFIHPQEDANGDFYRPDLGNYMSYYPDNCRCGFTHGQYTKMAETYLASSPRMW